MIITSYSPRATLKSVCLMCSLTLFSGYVLSEDSPEFDPMTPLAEEYVHLGLLMQNYDKLEYLYIGPEEWRGAAREKQVSACRRRLCAPAFLNLFMRDGR